MIGSLKQAVGPGMPNLPEDVRQVADWLTEWSRRIGNRMGTSLHWTEWELHDEIRRFQREVMHSFHPRRRHPAQRPNRAQATSATQTGAAVHPAYAAGGLFATECPPRHTVTFAAKNWI